MNRTRWFAPLARAGSLALACAATAPASAHDAPYSFLNVEVGRPIVTGTLTAHVDDLAHESGDPADSLRGEASVRRVAPGLWSVLVRRVSIVADGDTLAPALLSARPDPERNGIVFAFSAPAAHVPSEVSIEARLFPHDPQHETYVNATVAGVLRQQELIDAGSPCIAFATGTRPNLGAVLLRFIGAGIHHIFIGPDHILFVLGLLLLGGSLGRLLKIVTGFTVAHSLTLVLATLGWLTPPARVIEPLIALSIVCIGLENLGALRSIQAGDGRTPRDRRALLAFVFGFVHGFGFASVLREFGLPAQALGWSLFAFNVGVELGQTAIVLTTAPFLAVLRVQKPAWGRRAVAFGSVAVMAAGAYWFVERVVST